MKSLAKLIIGLVLICLGCTNNPKQAGEAQNENAPLNKLAYLEKHQNKKHFVFEGTATHKELIALDAIPYTFESRSDLFDEEGVLPTEMDTSWAEIHGDTIYVVHVVYTVGNCLKQIPYLQLTEDDSIAMLYTPEIVSATVEKTPNGYDILEEGCAIETVAQMTYRIPMASISATRLAHNFRVIYEKP